jgi:Tat protein secretion system quality control protein TatD with DNase activity
LLLLRARARRAALDLGFYLSMSGIAAFPKATICARSSPSAPLDRILVETDSPYLAPPAPSRQAQRAGLHRRTPPASAPRSSA